MVPPLPSDDHSGASCPQNPTPQYWDGFKVLPPTICVGVSAAGPSNSPQQQPPPGPWKCVAASIVNQCRFTRRRYSHVFSDCHGPHGVLNCPHRQSSSPGRGPSARNWCPSRNRPQPSHPNLPSLGRSRRRPATRTSRTPGLTRPHVCSVDCR